MNVPTAVIGLAAFLFGIYTIYLRSADPGKLGKLKPMQEYFGEKRGTFIHLISYSIIPIVFGLIMLVAGIRGVSFF